MLPDLKRDSRVTGRPNDDGTRDDGGVTSQATEDGGWDRVGTGELDVDKFGGWG